LQIHHKQQFEDEKFHEKVKKRKDGEDERAIMDDRE